MAIIMEIVFVLLAQVTVVITCYVCDIQEEESKEGNDGVLGYTRLFSCAPHKGYFTGLHNVTKDSRFTESSQFIHRNPNLC